MVNRAAIKVAAKQSLSSKWGVAIGASIVGGLIIGVASSIIPGIGGFVLSGVISTGLAIIFLEIIRNWQCNFEDLFKGFNNFGTTCCSGILVGVYTFLWALLLVIPGIIKSFSYSMTYYILADNPNMTASEAITASCVLMDGHKWDLFVLYLSFLGWMLLAIPTFGFLYLYIGPYMEASTAMFYEAIRNEKQANAQYGNPAQTVL